MVLNKTIHKAFKITKLYKQNPLISIPPPPPHFLPKLHIGFNMTRSHRQLKGVNDLSSCSFWGQGTVYSQSIARI